MLIIKLHQKVSQALAPVSQFRKSADQKQNLIVSPQQLKTYMLLKLNLFNVNVFKVKKYKLLPNECIY